MRLLAFFILILLSLTAYAVHQKSNRLYEIKCYSSGKLIYSGFSKNVYFDELVVVFKENKSNKDYFIFSDCIIKV